VHRNKWHFTALDWANWPAQAADVQAMLDQARGR
jgi:hypothetical protein